MADEDGFAVGRIGVWSEPAARERSIAYVEATLQHNIGLGGAVVVNAYGPAER